MCLNIFWDTNVYSLHVQLRFYFTNLYCAHQYQTDQMGSGPALQICVKIKEAKTKIEMEELLGFVEKIFTMDFEDVFKAPEIESSETPALRKRKRDKHLKGF